MPGFTFGFCTLKLNGKYGVIDHNNNVIVPFIWDYAQIMSADRIIVKSYDSYGSENCEAGIINFKGQWIMPLAQRTFIPIADKLWRDFY